MFSIVIYVILFVGNVHKRSEGVRDVSGAVTRRVSIRDGVARVLHVHRQDQNNGGDGVPAAARRYYVPGGFITLET